MNGSEFKKIRQAFVLGDVDKKIEIYTTQEGLTLGQYKELLRTFPTEEWTRLEKAMETDSQ